MPYGVGMKIRTKRQAALILVSTLAWVGLEQVQAAETAPVGDEEKLFYALGLELAEGIRVFSLSADELAMVQAGLRDATLKNPDGTPVNPPAVDRTAYREPLQALARARATSSAEAEPSVADKAHAEESESSDAEAAPNTEPVAEDGAAFLKRAAAEKGARTLTTGVVITKLVSRKHGRSPRREDTVRVHYRGTLIDGTEFDSSYGRGEPTVFPLNRVIACWTSGVGVMKVGEKARLVCPSETAYGKRGALPNIPPDAVLVFEVELLGVE